MSFKVMNMIISFLLDFISVTPLPPPQKKKISSHLSNRQYLNDFPDEKALTHF